jgi:indolepyruvate decarboxylase
MKLYQFLFDLLYQQGVRQIFGIPGDFVLNLYQALEQYGKFQLVTLSHEPAVGFAADGSARITNGLGVCLITYGAGGLNMVNSVACAYAEESPIVIISGGPGRAEKRTGVMVHHEVKSYESQFRVYQEVVEFGAILDDPGTAAVAIRRAINVALKFTRPVYLEVPRDMVFSEITIPANFEEIELKVDQGAVEEAAHEIVERLTNSRYPVIIVGVEVRRLHLQDKVLRLAERLQAPVASSFLGRGVFPTLHPQFVGTYLGTVSSEPLRRVVEKSDCILLLGERVSDTSLGISADCINQSNTILCISRDVFVRHHRYQNTPLDQLVDQLLGSPELPTKKTGLPNWKPDISPEVFEPYTDDEPIKVRHLISVVNDFLKKHPDLPVVADTGDCLFASVDVRANICVAPAYYATMGFSIPAAIGLQVSSQLRPIVLVGDGGFQMTGPEISQCARYGLNPIIILFNNNRWEMLQAFFPEADYNDTVAWPYAELAELWGAVGSEVRTPGELRSALENAYPESRCCLIEVKLSQGDISPILKGFVDGFRKRVYTS